MLTVPSVTPQAVTSLELSELIVGIALIVIFTELAAPSLPL